ncbi:MAG: hypothetical protein AB7H43_10730 [Acidimicrobiia bacterium]
MTIRGLLTQTVLVHHHSTGADNAYGVAADQWDAGTSHRARLEQATGSESTVDQDVQASDWRLFLDAGVAIGGRDRVVADGVTYEVVGPPLIQRTPRGPHHVEATLRVVAS